MDLAFIRFYLNDFFSAKMGDDSYSSTIKQETFIWQSPCGLFAQYSDVSEGMSFVGGIKVELIDCSETVIKDVTNFFYYDTYVLNGKPQINWVFGKVGVDYYTKRLFLRVTDLVNDNKYYSSGFIITNLNSQLSTEAVYTETTRFRGIPYDLKPMYQRVGFYKCYYREPLNKTNGGEYTQTDGLIANFRQSTTFGKSYVFDKLDNAIDNRLNVLFAHSVLYLNGERSKKIDYTPEKLVQDANWKTATFTVNPQNEPLFNVGNQLFEPLTLNTFTPSGRYTVDSFPNDIIGVFNKVITLGVGTLKIYDEFNNLIVTFTEADITVDGNLFGIDNSAFVKTLKSYYVIISEGLFLVDGCDKFSVTNINELTFEIQSAQYHKPDYSNQYS